MNSIYTTNSWEITVGVAYLLIIILVLIGLYVFLSITLSIENNEEPDNSSYSVPKLIVGIIGLCIWCFLTAILFNHGNDIREATDYYKSNDSTIIDKKYSNGMFNDSYSIIAEIDVNGEKFRFKEYITENQYNLISVGDTWNHNQK